MIVSFTLPDQAISQGFSVILLVFPKLRFFGWRAGIPERGSKLVSRGQAMLSGQPSPLTARTANRRFSSTDVLGTQERKIARRLLIGRLLNFPPDRLMQAWQGTARPSESRRHPTRSLPVPTTNRSGMSLVWAFLGTRPMCWIRTASRPQAATRGLQEKGRGDASASSCKILVHGLAVNVWLVDRPVDRLN